MAYKRSILLESYQPDCQLECAIHPRADVTNTATLAASQDQTRNTNTQQGSPASSIRCANASILIPISSSERRIDSYNFHRNSFAQHKQPSRSKSPDFLTGCNPLILTRRRKSRRLRTLICKLADGSLGKAINAIAVNIISLTRYFET